MVEQCPAVRILSRDKTANNWRTPKSSSSSNPISVWDSKCTIKSPTVSCLWLLLTKVKGVKVHTLDIAPLRSESPPQKRSGIARVVEGFHSFACTVHTHTFIRNRNEPYLPLPSQPQLVIIYRSRRDGRLSRPWCEVAQAEIQTRNLPIAIPALYHTATSASHWYGPRDQGVVVLNFEVNNENPKQTWLLSFCSTFTQQLEIGH